MVTLSVLLEYELFCDESQRSPDDEFLNNSYQADK